MRRRPMVESGIRLLQLFEHRPARIERVELVLRVVVHLDVGAEGPLAAVEGQGARQDLEQRGLPRPVHPDERHALAALDGEVRAPIHDLVSIGLVDVGEAGDDPPRARGLGKLEMDSPSARVDLDPIHLVEHLDPALDLARLRRLIAEAVDEPLDLGHALGLVARARLEERVPGLPLDEKMIVVAGVDGDGAPDQVGDRRHHAVQEVPVVGDEHHACRRRTRESSPATRGTRGPGDWSARRAAGGPVEAGAGVPAPPACAIRRRTARADDGPPPA